MKLAMKAVAAPAPKAMKKAMKVKAMKTRDKSRQRQSDRVLRKAIARFWEMCQNMKLNHSRKPETILAAVVPEL
jgi:hypothetical protein